MFVDKIDMFVEGIDMFVGNVKIFVNKIDMFVEGKSVYSSTKLYDNWRASVRPSAAGLGHVHFQVYTFVLDIHCQQLGNI